MKMRRSISLWPFLLALVPSVLFAQSGEGTSILQELAGLSPNTEVEFAQRLAGSDLFVVVNPDASETIVYDSRLKEIVIRDDLSIKPAQGEFGGLDSAKLLPNGRLVLGFANGTLKFFDVRTGIVIQPERFPATHRLNEIQVLTLRDHTLIATHSYGSPTLGQITVYDPDTGRILQRIQNAADSYTAVTAMPDGSLLAANYSGLRNIDPLTGKTTRSYDLLAGTTVVRLRPLKDGRILSQEYGGSLGITDLGKRSIVTIAGDPPHWTNFLFEAANNQIVTVRPSYSNDRSHRIFVWDAKTGALVKTLEAQSEILEASQRGPETLLLRHGDNSLSVWDLRTLAPVGEIPAESRFSRLAILIDGPSFETSRAGVFERVTDSDPLIKRAAVRQTQVLSEEDRLREERFLRASTPQERAEYKARKASGERAVRVIEAIQDARRR